LLVMGTIARTGITGVFVGNTAERLLPQIPCSVLAIKPAGFKSPITPE
jgi:universal stress protein E